MSLNQQKAEVLLPECSGLESNSQAIYIVTPGEWDRQWHVQACESWKYLSAPGGTEGATTVTS